MWTGVQLINVFLILTQGQNSSAGKLKTLSGALDIMRQTQSVFQLIKTELVAECNQVIIVIIFKWPLIQACHMIICIG